MQFRVLQTLLLDFVYGMEHGSVMLAAELPSDFGQRRGRELLDDVHRHLARESNRVQMVIEQ